MGKFSDRSGYTKSQQWQGEKVHVCVVGGRMVERERVVDQDKKGIQKKKY